MKCGGQQIVGSREDQRRRWGKVQYRPAAAAAQSLLVLFGAVLCVNEMGGWRLNRPSRPACQPGSAWPGLGGEVAELLGGAGGGGGGGGAGGGGGSGAARGGSGGLFGGGPWDVRIKQRLLLVCHASRAALPHHLEHSHHARQQAHAGRRRNHSKPPAVGSGSGRGRRERWAGFYR